MLVQSGCLAYCHSVHMHIYMKYIRIYIYILVFIYIYIYIIPIYIFIGNICYFINTFIIMIRCLVENVYLKVLSQGRRYDLKSLFKSEPKALFFFVKIQIFQATKTNSIPIYAFKYRRSCQDWAHHEGR